MYIVYIYIFISDIYNILYIYMYMYRPLRCGRGDYHTVTEKH